MGDLKRNSGTVAPRQSDAVIRVEKVSKLFQTPSRENLDALMDIELTIRPGEFITVVGPSGCGKSTLLRLIAGFSPCSSGRIVFQGKKCAASIRRSVTCRRKASCSRG